MTPGFHTISLLLHDEVTAANELAKIGFQSIAIRPRLGGLDPNSRQFVAQIMEFMSAAKQLNHQVVFDIDASFYHSPGTTLGPSLSSRDEAEANEAQAWIEKWIEVVSEHGWSGSNLITFATGTIADADAESESDESLLDRLASRLNLLVDRATQSNVRLGVRPVAGQTIAKVSQFERLRKWLSCDGPLLLAADVSEMILGGEIPIGERLSRNSQSLCCVYVGDPLQPPCSLVQLDVSLLVKSLKRCEFRGPLIFRIPGRSEQGLAIANDAWQLLAEC